MLPGGRSVLTHVVLFRFDNPTDVPEAVARLRALKHRVPAALSLRVGTNLNETDVAHQVILVSEHRDEDGLDEYRTHPAHVEVLAWLADHPHQRVALDSVDLA